MNKKGWNLIVILTGCFLLVINSLFFTSVISIISALIVIIGGIFSYIFAAQGNPKKNDELDERSDFIIEKSASLGFWVTLLVVAFLSLVAVLAKLTVSQFAISLMVIMTLVYLSGMSYYSKRY